MEDTMRFIRYIATLIISVVIIYLYSGCDAPNDPKYDNTTDPNPTGKTAAVIESVFPEAAFPGEELTIYGSGFDPNPIHNMVAFGTKVAKIISASETELIVQAPDIINEIVIVRVAVKGSEFWSNEFEFRFWDVVTMLTDQIPDPTGADMDDEFNTYVGSKADQRIYKIDIEGAVSVFAEGVPVNGAIKFGAERNLYVATTAGVSKIAPDGNTIESFVSLNNVLDFDWDQSGNLYLLVANGVHRYDIGGTITRVTTNNAASGVRVYDDHVYVAEQWLGRVQRYRITDTGVEHVDIPFRYTSALSGLEIDQNGKLYIGAWFRTYLLAANSVDDYDQLFEEELPTNIARLNYFGKSIIAVQTGATGTVYRLYIGINGAPKYGR
jgi:hypothetical protein